MSQEINLKKKLEALINQPTKSMIDLLKIRHLATQLEMQQVIDVVQQEIDKRLK